MFYSEKDKADCTALLRKRLIRAAVLLLVPQIPAVVLMLTARSLMISTLLSCLGIAGCIFYWGFCVSPVISYYRFLKEILGGRNHEFVSTLTSFGEKSLREGVPCQAFVFSDEKDDERLCYLDEVKLPGKSFSVGQKYFVTVHGQSILQMQSES